VTLGFFIAPEQEQSGAENKPVMVCGSVEDTCQKVRNVEMWEHILREVLVVSIPQRSHQIALDSF
jgi:hypothetical protein